MRRRIGLLSIATASLLLVACPPGFPAQTVEPGPVLDPFAFFDGPTRGEGVLRFWLGVRKPLTVDGFGQLTSDGTFQLDQTITYADGKVETRQFLLRQTDANRYTGSLTGAVGTVRATVTGNLLHLRYLMRKPGVFVEQWLYLQPDGRTVINQAEITVLGIPFARLSEQITHEASSSEQQQRSSGVFERQALPQSASGR
jgi:hypothetical protein